MFIKSFLERSPLVLRLLLVFLILIYLWFFSSHMGHMLAYPFPLDYGEGPILAQLERLDSGMPIWKLYADPAQSPYFVVNYPPVYHLSSLFVKLFSNNLLLAGRLVSLLATIGSVIALGLLGSDGRAEPKRGAGRGIGYAYSLLCGLIFLSIPVVREWAGYLRVDALALCLGLWGLLLVRKGLSSQSWGAPIVGGLLLVLSLYTKPSLIAAPVVGGLVWLLSEQSLRRRALVLACWAAFALVPFGVMQIGSEGWFWHHVISANTNRWEAELAWSFWAEQLGLRWALLGAGLLGLVLVLARHNQLTRLPWWAAALYTLLGTLTAIGVGKVGAYANYFLEWYAGLIWLSALGWNLLSNPLPKAGKALQQFGALALPALLAVSMLWYSPLWSRTSLHPAGLLEPNPPQLFFEPSKSVLSENEREAEVLAAQARVNAALNNEIHQLQGEIFVDTPAIAAQAGALSPYQAFEHRQLLDSQLWDQSAILAKLANGEYPLAVLDYLGNWLSPEMVNLILHRYAQDGSYGNFDLFRPIALGPLQERSDRIGPLELHGLALSQADSDNYSVGDLLSVLLEWRMVEAYDGPEALNVVLELRNSQNEQLLEDRLSLLYGSLSPKQWPLGEPIQHLQPIDLPSNLPSGSYSLNMRLEDRNGASSLTIQLAQIELGPSRGYRFSETNWYVPAPFWQSWQALGGLSRVGLPLTPAVPFGWGRLQCFEYLCLEEREGQIQQRPLGEQLFLSETQRGNGDLQIDPALQPLWHGFGEPSLGPPISGIVQRNAYQVQWTRFARLERHPYTQSLGLGRLGEDTLRLPPGVRYRWPVRP
jgi:hypothetical protein